MLITRIWLKNWKNFQDVDVVLGKRVFLIGPNASGKSNFLDAFRFLRDVAERGLGYAVDARGGISRIRCLAARKNPDVTIGVVLDDLWRYEICFGGDKGKTPIIKSEQVKKVSRKVLKRPDDADKEDPERLTQSALEQVSANKDFRDIPDFLRTIAYRHILPQTVRDPKNFSAIPAKDDPFGRDFVFQVWNTREATRKPRLSRITEALKSAVPQLDKLDVEMEQATGVPHLKAIYQHWRLPGAKEDESSFSDGTLRLLALLWSLTETGGPLLLEEPELSLHDEVVRRLPGMFAKLDQGRKKTTRQILVSTHSRVLLSDPGIGPGEILILRPGENGTEIHPPDQEDENLMQGGFVAADVLFSKTKPSNVEQLSLFKL